MRSQQIVAWGKPLVANEMPTPAPQGTEILIEVTACGICHSDLHLHQGYFDLGDGKRLSIAERGLSLPFTLGHETAGRVAAVGPDSHGIEVGKSYVVYPWIGCGDCRDCQGGRELYCTKPKVIGTWVDGGYSTHVIVPHARYLVDHGDIPVEVACTYACSGVTAYSGLKKTELDRSDQWLLLVGAGGVGMNALLMAKAVLGCKVAVADLDPAKREAAIATGICDAVFDNGDAEAVAQIKELTDGGADAALDFVGRPESLTFAMNCGRPKGAKIVVIGLYGDQINLSTALLPLRVIDLRGSYVGTLDDLKAVMQLAHQGVLPPIKVTKCPLDDANQALEDLQHGRITGRLVLEPSP